jgi:hypothetical protein
MCIGAYRAIGSAMQGRVKQRGPGARQARFKRRGHAQQGLGQGERNKCRSIGPPEGVWAEGLQRGAHGAHAYA